MVYGRNIGVLRPRKKPARPVYEINERRDYKFCQKISFFSVRIILPEQRQVLPTDP